ncbi:SLATT domain-containing protein [Aeromicrobium fastidiosum]|nr:SLATT domain-containing protein [Aeromicrobium fastidiosum]
MPDGLDVHLRGVGAEFSRLEESARFSGQCQFEQFKFWRSWNWILGIPAFALGAWSGAAVIGNTLPDVYAGSMGLVGATLAGVMTLLSAERRADRAAIDANAFQDIQQEARQALLVDLLAVDVTRGRGMLADLTRRYEETRRSAEPVFRLSYRRARRNIREGGQSFGVDRKSGAPRDTEA